MSNRKKMLSALLSATGLFLDSVNINAMEDGKKIVSMRSIAEKPENKGKPLWEVINSPHGVIPKNTKDLMTKKELENFLNTHKQDIVWAVHAGDAARREAMERAELVHYWRSAINNELATKFKKLGIENAMSPPTLEHSLRLFKKDGYKKHRVGGYLNVTTTKNAEQNWLSFGRGPLHGVAYDSYEETSRYDKIKAELKRLAAGEVNCTCWADLIRWFLLENGVCCKVMSVPGHQFTLTAVKGKNGTGIYFCRIGVKEKGEKPEDIEFKVEFLTDLRKREIHDKQWDGMVESFNGNSYADSKYHETPLYQYQVQMMYIMDYIRNKTERMHGLVWGFKKEIKNLGEELTDGKGFWNVRVSPRYNNTLTIPLNLDQLGKAAPSCCGFENLKSTSGNGDAPVAYIYASIALPTSWEKDYKYGSVILEKPDFKNRTINAKLISSDKKRTTNLTGKIRMMDWGKYDNYLKNYETQVERFHGWWEDPSYNPPKIEEIPTVKEKDKH